MNDSEDFGRHVRQVVTSRYERDDAMRCEALRDFLALRLPDLGPGAVDRLAALVPAIVPQLRAKWAGMFADRLVKTLPRDQLEHLCDGSRENKASLVLAYVMFMESERMEKQVDEDLAGAALAPDEDEQTRQAVAEYLRARMGAPGGAGGAGGGQG
jgi:hypothetical protein